MQRPSRRQIPEGLHGTHSWMHTRRTAAIARQQVPGDSELAKAVATTIASSLFLATTVLSAISRPSAR